MSEPTFFFDTPLVKCTNLPIGEQHEVYFKFENLQPSGSFKDRGISNMVNEILKTETVGKLISSSGGNAGHAVATVGQKLGIPVDVYVPMTTKPMMIAKLKKKGANVFVHGANWNEADKLARQAVAADPTAQYIPPYDDPRIWEGNSTIVDDLAKAGIVPDKIVLSVGGGGLLAGIQRGILRHNWQNRTKVVAVETEGAASFARAHEAGQQPVTLSAITSIASSLGALSVTPGCLNTGVETIPHVVSDADAVRACRRLADDFKMLVEPACGAALSYVYCPHPTVTRSVIENEVSTAHPVVGETIVVIVCGGSVVNIELLAQWCKEFDVSSEYV